MIKKNSDNLLKHVYIHVPFCVRKCNYCSFVSYNDLSLIKAWEKAVIAEIKLCQQNLKIESKTIYFGGGTPSLIKPNVLENIIDLLSPDSQCEITIEVNPFNVNKTYLKELNKTRINRISMGAQSFNDKNLKMLGRLHDSQTVYKSFNLLREAGYKNLSLDLIYGLPGQSVEDLRVDLEALLDLSPEHLSIYCLSLEKDVPLFSKRGLIPEDEIVSTMYNLIREKFAENGYRQYEISNFTKPGFESKHNLSYWSDKYYLGIGPAASGYLKGLRYTNPENFNDYLSSLAQEKLFIPKDKISREIHKREFLFLGLRKTQGINLQEYKEKFGNEIELDFGVKIRKYLDLNMLKIEKGYLKLFPEAYFVSDEVFSDLL